MLTENTIDQTTLLFEPEKLRPDYAFDLPNCMTEVFISVDKGIELNGLFFGKYTDAPLMIYFQGNAKNLRNFLDNHAMVLDWGYNLLVCDYRGFGKSGGEILSEEQLYGDAEKVYGLALTLGFTPENIILYGYSMGAAMVAHLASCRQAMAVVMESGYSSINEMEFAAGLCPDFLLDNVAKAKRISMPALVIHGINDEIITPDHADRIFSNLASKTKQLFILDGGHGDLKAKPRYPGMINDFIHKVLIQRS